VALALASTAIALVLAEVAARRIYPFFQSWPRPAGSASQDECGPTVQFDEDVGWWPKPHLDCLEPAERSVRFRTNSLGFRSDREFGPKPDGIVRVAVLGDSFTFGALVTREETYAALLERAVPMVEMVNFGLGGGGPDQSLLALRHKGRTLQIDALIVAPSVENIERVLMTERDGRPKPYFTLATGGLELHNHPVPRRALQVRAAGPVGTGGPVLGQSALWQLLLAGMRPVTLRTGVYRPYAAEYGGSAGALLEQILMAFRVESGDRPIVFAPLPTYHYFEYDIPQDYEPVFRRAADSVNAVYVDVLPAFKRLPPEERRALRFRFDQHYTPAAHRVVAHALRPYVMALRDAQYK
jgi:hypothetical protein